MRIPTDVMAKIVTWNAHQDYLTLNTELQEDRKGKK